MVNKRILIAGEGGQGVQTIAKILSLAAYEAGKKVAYLPNFGVEQRGGVSLSFVQFSSEEIPYPKFQEADIAVILAHRAVPRIAKHIGPRTVIMFDNSIINESEIAQFKVEKIAVPASFIAKNRLIPRVFNVIILGAISEEIKIFEMKIVKKVLLKFLSAKIKQKNELKNFNLAALDIGHRTVKDLTK